MARKNRDGKFILSAGEVGTYTVCPEAWRLKTLERAKSTHAESVIEGQARHHQWAKKFDDAKYLNERVRFVFALFAAAALAYLLTHSGTP